MKLWIIPILLIFSLGTVLAYDGDLCTQAHSPCGGGCTSTDLSDMFNGVTNWDSIGDITGWDTSCIINMNNMFANSNFNQNIGGWNTSTVTDMYGMFQEDFDFNQDVSSWDTSQVTNTSYMFRDCTYFNQPIGSWDVSKVTNMDSMLEYTSFNQDLSGWNTSSVTNMAWLFDGLTTANSLNIGGWDTSHVTNMQGMFVDCQLFNDDISSWDVGQVTNMDSVLSGTSVFNQDIGLWNTSSVTDMQSMFYGASAFNQDISSWDTSHVTSMYFMFRDSGFNQPIGVWNTSSVTNTQYLFFGTSFNQDISSWDVSHVTTMNNMFQSSSFNQDISSWDTGAVTNMANMFRSATSFDQDLSNWNISQVTSMANMFYGITLSTTNYDALLNSWANQAVQSSVVFNGGSSTYSSTGLTDRNTLIDSYSWSITDGGCSGTGCPFPTCNTTVATLNNNSDYTLSVDLDINYTGTAGTTSNNYACWSGTDLTNVLIDCQGHYINNVGNSVNLFLLRGATSNVTIQNCVAYNNVYGFAYTRSTDTSIDGLTFINNALYRANSTLSAGNNRFSYINIPVNHLSYINTIIRGGRLATIGLPTGTRVDNILIDGLTMTLPGFYAFTFNNNYAAIGGAKNLTIRNAYIDNDYTTGPSTGIFNIYDIRNLILDNITVTNTGANTTVQTIFISGGENLLLTNVSMQYGQTHLTPIGDSAGIIIENVGGNITRSDINTDSADNIGWLPWKTGYLDEEGSATTWNSAYYAGCENNGRNYDNTENTSLHMFANNFILWNVSYSACSNSLKTKIYTLNSDRCYNPAPPADNGTTIACANTPPIYDNKTFNGMTTTDLGTVPDITAVNLTIASSGSAIQWLGLVNLENITSITSILTATPTIVSINSATAPELDSPALVALSIPTTGFITCSAFTLYHASGYYTTQSGILSNGQIIATSTNVGGDCIDPSICTNIQCSGGVLTFEAQHFDGFTIGEVPANTVESCQNTRQIIYAGFALIAVLIIAGAAALLLFMFKSGNMDGTMIIAATVGFIAVAVVIMVGYYIISHIPGILCG